MLLKSFGIGSTTTADDTDDGDAVTLQSGDAAPYGVASGNSGS